MVEAFSELKDQDKLSQEKETKTESGFSCKDPAGCVHFQRHRKWTPGLTRKDSVPPGNNNNLIDEHHPQKILMTKDDRAQNTTEASCLQCQPCTRR